MIRVSPSQLSLFRDCSRCFWLDKVAGVPRPRGIFPSLPKGMDKVMKSAVERDMAAGKLAHWLSGVEGAQPYPQRTLLEKFRSWRTFQATVNCAGVSITFSGELDELIYFPEPEPSLVAPWDYKTKGSAPEEGYAERYYQTQVDVYHLLLEGNGLQCTGHGYFTFVWPESFEGDQVKFAHTTLAIGTDPERAKAVAYNAAMCLEGKIPEASPNCEYCPYTAKIAGRATSSAPSKKTKGRL